MVLHKPLRLISYWQLQTLGWVCFYAWTLLGALPDLLRRSGALRENTEVVGLLFLGSCVLHPVCRWLLRRYPSWVAFELRAFGVSVTIGAAVAFVYELTVRGLHHMNAVNLVVNSANFPFLLFCWSSLYFSIKQWHTSSQERERLLRAEAEVQEARLQALRYQLNPHFLFNSLNAVSTLVLDGEASAATKMLSQIGDFLRTSLNDQALEAPLSQEMAFTEQYIAIEKTRLGDRLQVELTISPDTLDAMVPGMLLQPLVENAVRHGVERRAGSGRVKISATINGDDVELCVSDDGLGIEPERVPVVLAGAGGGIGLSNVDQRLRATFGERYALRIDSNLGQGTTVVMTVPNLHGAADRELAERAGWAVPTV